MEATDSVRLVKRSDIKTSHDLALFPINKAERTAIAASMREHGFDFAQPLVRWKETGYLVDGHTRLEAATDANIDDLPVLDYSFEDFDAALDYAIARQRDRRNLTRQQINAYIANVVRADKSVMERGGDRRSSNFKGSREPLNGKSSAEDLAKKVGVSSATIKRTRAVLASDQEETKSSLLAGDIAPTVAYQQVISARSAQIDSADTLAAPADPTTLFDQAQYTLPASFSLAEWAELDASIRAEAIRVGRATSSALNSQNTDNIEWAKWSWNPITGCLHACPYCYARDIANRFYVQKFAPTFLPQRLSAPAHQQVPKSAETELGYRNIFTCSMADLFGKWVPAGWIQAVLDVVNENPQWNFLFLTKFPNRLAEFTFPQNAWLGTSVDCQARVKNAERAFAQVQGGIKWLSIEPMLEPIRFNSLDMFQWVVIGGASSSTETPEWIPPRRWVMDLEQQATDAGCMIYEKTNLGFQNAPSRLREYPGWKRPERLLPSALKYLPSME